jgi:hypothetical protein
MSILHSKPIATGYVSEYFLAAPVIHPRLQIRKVIATLAEQYKTKEKDLDKFKQEYNIRPVQ